VDLGRREVRRETTVRLTALEAQLLGYLADRPDQVISRDELLNEVWGYREGVMTRAVDSLVGRLRHKLEPDPAKPRHLLGLYGQGYILEDVEREEVADQANEDYQALKPLRVAARGKLPRPSTPFIGRSTEVVALREAWSGGQRLTTLLGCGGAGKTRLAVHFGAEVCEGGSEVHFCDLGSATGLGQVLQIIAERAAVPLVAASDERVDALGLALEGQGEALWILDNAEGATEAVAGLMTRWLGSSTSPRFLVTSRERLRIMGEQLLELGPLRAEDGAALFVQRARAVRPGFREEGQDATVSELVRQLDGLPLAIELAAARSRLLNPKTILARLSERFALLQTDGRDVPPRQATLKATIDWSWHRLKPSLQQALRQLTIFQGAFSLEGAQDVLELDSGASAGEVVEALLDRSMLRSVDLEDGSRRFGMFVSVRAYVSEKLDAEEQAAAELRHAAFVVSEGESLGRGLSEQGAVAGWRRLAELGPDLEAALGRSRQAAPTLAVRAALALAPIYAVRGPFGVFARLLNDELLAEVGAQLQLEARLERAHALRLGGSMDRARRELDALLADATEAGDTRIELGTLAEQTHICQQAGEYAEALASYELLLPRLREAGMSDLEGFVLCSVGSLTRLMGRQEESEHFLRQALAIHRLSGNRRMEAIARVHLGGLSWTRREAGEAELHYRAAEQGFREVGDSRGAANALGNLGVNRIRQGRLEEALELLEESLSLHRRVGNRRSGAVCLANFGRVNLELGKLEEARNRLHEGLLESRAVQDRRVVAGVLGLLGLVERLDSRPEASERYFIEGIELADAVGAYSFRSRLRGHLALLQADMGRLDEAEATIAEAETIQGEPFPFLDGCRGLLELVRAQSAPPAEAEALRVTAAERLPAESVDDEDARLVRRWLLEQLASK
jgi:predicted ATPase/DNA-binding winged helix-turn-helix (wHTH) protein